MDGLYPAFPTVSNGDNPKNHSGYENANIFEHPSERELWRKRVGQIVDNKMRRSFNLCNTIPFKHWDESRGVFHDFNVGKSCPNSRKHKDIGHETNHALVYSDVAGPVRFRSFSSSQYFFTMINQLSALHSSQESSAGCTSGDNYGIGNLIRAQTHETCLDESKNDSMGTI